MLTAQFEQFNTKGMASKQNNVEMYRIKEPPVEQPLYRWFGFHMCKSSELGVAGAYTCTYVYAYVCMYLWMLFPFQAVVDWCAQHFVNHSFIHPTINPFIHSFILFFFLSFSIVCSSVHSFVRSLLFKIPNVDAVAVAAFDGFAIGKFGKASQNTLHERAFYTFHIPYHVCICVCVCICVNYYHKRFFHSSVWHHERVAEKSKTHNMYVCVCNAIGLVW